MDDAQEVKNLLTGLEEDARNSTGVRYISGGYASAKVVSEDSKYYFIDLRWGVVNDVEDRKHLEHYKILKKHFSKEMTVEELFSKVRYIS